MQICESIDVWSTAKSRRGMQYATNHMFTHATTHSHDNSCHRYVGDMRFRQHWKMWRQMHCAGFMRIQPDTLTIMARSQKRDTQYQIALPYMSSKLPLFGIRRFLSQSAYCGKFNSLNFFKNVALSLSPGRIYNWCTIWFRDSGSRLSM